MAFTEFYEAASRTAKSGPVRAFMAEMAQRSRNYWRLMDEFTEHVTANRKRREGKPAKLTKAGREFLADADAAGREAERDAPRLAARLSDQALLEFAVDDWQENAELLDIVGHHEDDRQFAARLRRFIKDSIKLAKKSLGRRGGAAVKPVPGGGLSFNVAFQRSVPGIGKLGGDCIFIEPTLPALDRILTDAKQPPLSDYVDPDPEKWVKGKTLWFDPATGLAAIRLLRTKLRRPNKKVKNRRAVVQDLAALEAALMEADERRIRFHFVILD